MVNIRKASAFAGLMAVGLSLSGCLSLSEELQRQEAEVRGGAFQSAYAQADAAAGKENADTAFWHQEAGTLALFLGQPTQATAHLDSADNAFNDVARRYKGASAWDQSKAVAVNDTVLPYAPEGVERVFANFYKAIAYGATGDQAAMRVELNRTRQRQYEWFYTCTKALAEQQSDLSQAQQRMVKNAVASETEKAGTQSTQLDAASVRSVVNDSGASATTWRALQGYGNAYVAHVAGITRWCAGDPSLNDLGFAAALASQNRFVQADRAEEAQGAVPSGRVWVYVEEALAPKRLPRTLIFPYPSIFGRGIGTITYNVPSLKERPALASRYAANAVSLEPLQDIDVLVQNQFDRYFPGMLARQLTRIFLRVATHEAASAALRETDDSGLLTLLLDVVMLGYDVSTNASDLRCADLLPKRVWLASLQRPENGQLQVTADGRSLAKVTLQTRGNTLVWVRHLSPYTPPICYVIDLEP